MVVAAGLGIGCFLWRMNPAGPRLWLPLSPVVLLAFFICFLRAGLLWLFLQLRVPHKDCL